jgi:hypothetical protein
VGRKRPGWKGQGQTIGKRRPCGGYEEARWKVTGAQAMERRSPGSG